MTSQARQSAIGTPGNLAAMSAAPWAVTVTGDGASWRRVVVHVPGAPVVAPGGGLGAGLVPRWPAALLA